MDAFEGVRILDLTVGTAGPLTAALFADFGADVLKIEQPAGDPVRASVAFVSYNRGKRGAVADPSDPADQQRVRELARAADMVVVRRAADLSGWGVDAVDLTETRNIIVLEVPPWHGPAPWAGGRESQALVSAASGYSRRQASYDGGPVDIVFPHLLYVQAVLAATAAAAALIERLRTGLGQVVTVDAVHAATELFTGNYTLDPDLPIPNSAVGPGGSNPTYSHYRGSDGGWFLVGGLTPKFQERALRAIGEDWIIDDPRVGGDLTTVYSDDNRDWIRECLTRRFHTRTRNEWLELLRAAGVPSAPMNEPKEAFAHEQTTHLGIRQKVKDAHFGELTMVGQPLRPARTPAEIRSGSPELGHPVTGVEWLPRSDRQANLGTGWVGRTGGSGTTGPLAGLRVLLMGSFVAGPYGAFLLGHLGADVIKIEPPEGDPWRARGFYYSDGMRSIAIDLNRPKATEVFRQLSENADAIVDNLRPGVARKLHVAHADVQEHNEDIVTVSLSGFGQHGPLAMEPGFDPVLQAWSGMCVAQGGDDSPVLYTVPVNDMSGAALIAFGATLGLFHRLRTGQGQAISTSLAAAGLFMQCGQLFEGTEQDASVHGGRDFLGPDELDRYYRVSDGWIRVEADPTTDTGEVRAALGADPDESLESAFATRTAETAVKVLTDLGLAAIEARLARDVVMSGQHPGRFELRRPTDSIRYYRPKSYAEFSRTQHDHQMNPPGAGEHTREILAELAFSDEQVDDLVADRTVHAGRPMVPRVLNPYR